MITAWKQDRVARSATGDPGWRHLPHDLPIRPTLLITNQTRAPEIVCFTECADTARSEGLQLCALGTYLREALDQVLFLLVQPGAQEGGMSGHFGDLRHPASLRTHPAP
ncbi:hypothetical protein PV682_39345 [Streptomyces niveiscabiei]|uniref:hypothetical protein n=1 Tax=Streptomyces niveiscabiei TaxID=164115 RepID=UPI0029ACE7EE|nr:hypothetical protein [Streptomyces niveiscabiei]MDX3387457.1 hypothetical protein [Streptomyces niveiscabiei]